MTKLGVSLPVHVVFFCPSLAAPPAPAPPGAGATRGRAGAGAGRATVAKTPPPAAAASSAHSPVDAALARLGNNRALYGRILQSYLGEIVAMPDQLDALLMAGDLGGAGRLLHTLKGLSAMFGQEKIAGLAHHLEDVLDALRLGKVQNSDALVDALGSDAQRLFDLLVQRLIEIWSNIPFLFVVIIFSSMVPDQFKGLPVILTILIVFGWMGMTYLMRTAAYRDKERDYIAAARVLGAGTPRILFRHLLPNTIAIIVTLVPFTMSNLVFSLISLDYLGFGLPPEYATWGRLLNDGLSNLSAPWLVTSTFVVLVGLLVIITFVGEAVREAFDPKKFTYYK